MKELRETFCKMEFTTDEDGREILLKDDKFQVMMEWEKPYMKACIDALRPTGDVLEVGFGCGYSATYIQDYHPKSHTIIEYHPEVAKKAREWAENYQNVTIIEDLWQGALPSLGIFDTIFFDDYPLQSEKKEAELKNSKTEASWIVKKGQKFLKKIQDKFLFLSSIQYKDTDIDYFFSNLKKKKSLQKEHFLPFFNDLKNKTQITSSQFDQVVFRLIEEKLIDLTTKEEFFNKIQDKKKEPFDFNQRGDRFFEFLEICLKSHMRQDSRFSCYLEHSSSRYEDEKFFNHIILNPALDFKEESIDIEVPEHCKYFYGNKALVMVITKRI